VFVFLSLFTLWVMAVMNVINGALITDISPSGILSFEFAGDLTSAQRMVETWGHSGGVQAGISLGLDYLFLVAYSWSIALGCVLVARSFDPRSSFQIIIGVTLAWAQFGAAFLDAIENYALIRILLGTQQELWSVVAKWCAIPKFILVAAGIVYILLGAVLALLMKTSRGKT
jgi:hypothetical protein